MMVDFTRRSFLKGLGLGTVAVLTLPKKMDVIAATLADLKDPPVSAGYARITIPQGFSINMFTFVNAEIDEQVTFQIRMMPEKTLLLAMMSGYGMLDYDCRYPVHMPGTALEVWATRRDGKPMLTPCTCWLRGTWHDGNGGYFVKAISAPLNHIRLDRVRAIQMGLIDPSEPEVEDPTEDTSKLVYDE